MNVRTRRRIARLAKAGVALAIGVSLGVAYGTLVPGAFTYWRVRLAEERAVVAKRDLDELRANHAEARKQLDDKESILAMLEERGVILPRLPESRPAIGAKVAAVKTDVRPNLVLLNVGSDHSVEKGFQFSIYRGYDLVGKVVVEKVLRDASGCRVFFTRDGMQIQADDFAVTSDP